MSCLWISGSFFGEGALQKDRYYHQRTAKALKDCDLTYLTKQDVWKIAQDYPVCATSYNNTF